MRSMPEDVREFFRLLDTPELKPRYNIAPTQPVTVVRQTEQDGQSAREIVAMHWGLIPSWSKDTKIGSRMINARAETVHEKPSFRAAFKKRRCLIPADGFYEWKKLDAKNKLPYFIGMKDQGLFAFAGLWERWDGVDNMVTESCTIITTEPNEVCKEIHNRMPVILSPDNYDAWLNPKSNDFEFLKSLLMPYPPEEMIAFSVSMLVNNPRNDSPGCIAISHA